MCKRVRSRYAHAHEENGLQLDSTAAEVRQLRLLGCRHALPSLGTIQR